MPEVVLTHVYRAVWTADAVSKIGSQVSVVALPMLALVNLHSNALQVGLLTAAAYAPFLVFGLPAGVIVDRANLRRLLVTCDLSRFGLLTTVPLLGALHLLDTEVLYVVAFFTGLFTVLFDSAHQSFVPQLVQPAELTRANSRLGANAAVAAGSGPGLAGWLTQVVSAAGAVFFDALSYLISALLLLRAPSSAHQRPSGVARPFDGFRHMWRSATMRAILIASMGIAFFDELLATVALIALIRLLPGHTGVAGTLLAVPALSAIAVAHAGPAVITRIGGSIALRAGAAISVCGSLLALLTGPGERLAWLIAGMACVAIGTTVFNVIALTHRQLSTPRQLRGRVNASMRFAVWGLIPVGALAGGAALSLGLQAAIAIAATGKLASALPLLLRSLNVVTGR